MNQERKDIEEVQKFKYLGFVFNRKGDYKDYIKELTRKGRMAVKKIWGLVERIYKNDFQRRWMLFKYYIQYRALWNMKSKYGVGRKKKCQKNL